jgi:hypothetical protein
MTLSIWHVQISKVWTKVELLDHVGRVPYALDEICAVPRMTFHGATIAVGHYSVAMTSIKKGQ